MPKPTTSLTAELYERGFVFVPGLLSPEEAREYRIKILNNCGVEEGNLDPTRRWLLGDGPNKCKEWWSLIVNSRILNLMHEIIGPEIRYLRNADLQVQNDRRIWHRDSPCRQFGKGPDFDESRSPYHVYRVGVYFHSYAESGSALGLVPGSHHREPWLLPHELTFWDYVRSELRQDYLLAPFVSVRPVWIKAGFGDCIIFDARVLHAPSKFHGPKLAAYLSYGANNEHSRAFYQHYAHDRKDLKYPPLDPELREILREKNLLLEETSSTVVHA